MVKSTCYQQDIRTIETKYKKEAKTQRMFRNILVCTQFMYKKNYSRSCNCYMQQLRNVVFCTLGIFMFYLCWSFVVYITIDMSNNIIFSDLTVKVKENIKDEKMLTRVTRSFRSLKNIIVFLFLKTMKYSTHWRSFRDRQFKIYICIFKIFPK